MRKPLIVIATGVAIALAGVSLAATVDPATVAISTDRVSYRTVDIDGTKVFYREAGLPSLPTLVLLHGNPSSSFMFRDLIPRLASNFHVFAPDYPGFGYSDTPPAGSYNYTFDHLAQAMNGFLKKVGATNYILYTHDYGGPIGFRIATAHPEQIKGIIIKNANAYEEGLSKRWRDELIEQIKNGKSPKPPAEPPTSSSATSLEDNLEWVKHMYVTGARDPATMTPDGYTFDAAMLSRPIQDPIQESMGGDYYTNVVLYPAWQKWLRTQRPPTLIVWGEGDWIFGIEGANAYKRDVPKARLVFYNSGHFLLEEYAPEVAQEIIRMFAVSAEKT